MPHGTTNQKHFNQMEFIVLFSFEDDVNCENTNLNEDISKFHIILTLRFIPFKAANPSSTNWPAPNVWGEVFVAQLVEHC